jgi:hypothetical protein
MNNICYSVYLFRGALYSHIFVLYKDVLSYFTGIINIKLQFSSKVFVTFMLCPNLIFV